MDVTLHGRDAEVVHLGLVMVDPSLRSSGLSWVLYGLTCLVLFVRRQLRPLWLSNVTQVPGDRRHGERDLLGRVSRSRPAGASQLRAPACSRARSCAAIARCSASAPDAGFDEARFVITNAYTGGSDNLKKSFDVAPKHRDEAYNDFCREQLDYERGDDVLQLCRLDLATAQRFVTKDVPRRSLPAVARHACGRVAATGCCCRCCTGSARTGPGESCGPPHRRKHPDHGPVQLRGVHHPQYRLRRRRPSRRGCGSRACSSAAPAAWAARR